MNGNMIIKNATELVTCSGLAAKKGAEMSELHIISDGAVVVKEGIIEAVGTTASQPSTLILGSIAAAMITILILGLIAVKIGKNKNR